MASALADPFPQPVFCLRESARSAGESAVHMQRNDICVNNTISAGNSEETALSIILTDIYNLYLNNSDSSVIKFKMRLWFLFIGL